jgi:sortase A
MRRAVAVTIAAAAGLAAAPSGAAADSVGAIVIPRIGLRTPIYANVTSRLLARGPGHLPETGLPGGGRTIAVAGHRTTHTHPFRWLNRLRRGDAIRIRTQRPGRDGRLLHEYRVTGIRVVRPWATWLIGDTGSERLVLSACTPPGSAKYRLVVIARPLAGLA